MCISVPLMENFIFCAVTIKVFFRRHLNIIYISLFTTLILNARENIVKLR